jgi:signal transduction histidine kinase/CheY-like chemotaxis protein
VLTSCNDRLVSILGSSKRLLIGLGMRTLPNRALVAELERALSGGHGLYEGPYQPATGVRESWVRVSFGPLLEDGALVGGVGLVDDLTERKHIEARLAEADRMASLGRLSAGVAHEINNPLTYVRTGVELAAREAELLHDALERYGFEAEWRRLRSSLHSCVEGVERVREIVAGLKAFSRSDDAPPKRVSLEACVDTAVNLAWNEIRHRATLEKSYGGVPPVIGSETRLVQVLVNLLVNAAQAIPVGDRSHHKITVRTYALPGSRVAVEVEDTGRGMGPEVLRHIFEPFWTDKARGEGTGLGLSICHGIISAAGGEIDVRSNPGVGSLFRVVLPEAPRGEAEAAPERASAAAKSAPPAQEKSRVLIVDDEPRLAWTLRMALSDQHDVVAVGTGKEAIERLLGGERFDLVLCDLMMPEVSGMDVFEAVTTAHPELTSRFVFMTGGAFTDRARAFLQDPRVRRLEKPFLIEDVEALIPAGVPTSRSVDVPSSG